MRDHRKLGKELELFTFSPTEYGQGLLCGWPKGADFETCLQDFLKKVRKYDTGRFYSAIGSKELM